MPDITALIAEDEPLLALALQAELQRVLSGTALLFRVARLLGPVGQAGADELAAAFAVAGKVECCAGVAVDCQGRQQGPKPLARRLAAAVQGQEAGRFGSQAPVVHGAAQHGVAHAAEEQAELQPGDLEMRQQRRRAGAAGLQRVL